ncbi:hypothetical protein HU200_002674 [Digitaria exilis]|uniref:Uncharacterized protein n=1 Tax=Digitaria exilis TaxID=1010633 RepID=A0A835FY05_9POAL|nr:hypothetical protein HU200_002674 [Digitaria exilis]
MAEIKIKMDKTSIILSAIVGVLGVLSAIFGFAAEGANSTVSKLSMILSSFLVFPFMVYDDLLSCDLLVCVMAQITVSAVSGCCGCCKSRAFPSETKRVIGIICAVGSWLHACVYGVACRIAAVAGCIMFEENAALNFRGYYIPGLYAGAGVLALAATALSVASYMLLRGQPEAAAKMPAGERPAPSGIAMGQPQFPPAAAPAPGAPNMQSPPQGQGQV